MGYAYTQAYTESPLVQKARALNIHTMALRKVYSDIRSDQQGTYKPHFENYEAKQAYELEVNQLMLKFNKGIL